MNYFNKKFILLIFICGVSFFVSQVNAQPSGTGVLLADSHGKIYYSMNKDQKFVPASILKVFTGLVALETWGPEHRFRTLFSFDRETGDLYIRGLGDPLFISEAAQMMCRQIVRETGLSQIRDIILDASFFHPDIRIPGTGGSLNPYDAVTGALCANFNTIAFKSDPLTQKYISAEPQTPFINAFLPLIQASGQNKGRIRLSPAKSQIYPGLLLKSLFLQMNIEVTGRIKPGKYRTAGMVEGIFYSPFSLNRVVQKLLQHSNNFMANQIMLSLGTILKVPGQVSTGIMVLKNYAKKNLGIPILSIVEGSGLSRQNRITPTQMLKILLTFMPYHKLMNNNEDEFYKTGTLTDVRSRTGYLKGAHGQLYPFVIMVNQPGKGYAGIKQKLKRMVLQTSETG